ncbi:hypothetical protein R5R35_012957 [Gryllus longicercus]|uniref:RWD domain-containing protein n=1 Tax=Gryllus longicercus TaxID=2509291 RepID=A0AAN9WDH1_9ORTH
MSDNLTRQVEEIEALSSIYGDEWRTEDETHRSYSILIKEGPMSVTMYVKLPPDYPSESPPVFQLSAPELTHSTKQQINTELNNVYIDNIGETIIYSWVEKIREILQDACAKAKQAVKEKIVIQHEEEYCASALTNVDIPDITHGEPITDRKSVFQGHAIYVERVEQVKKALEVLCSNRKIANATHNIYAYRIFKPDTKSYIQDCEDDGETQAGGRLLHLLQILNVKNVLVVVSRWYGGVHLGPDRFRHINNAARQVLCDANFIKR